MQRKTFFCVRDIRARLHNITQMSKNCKENVLITDNSTLSHGTITICNFFLYLR